MTVHLNRFGADTTLCGRSIFDVHSWPFISENLSIEDAKEHCNCRTCLTSVQKVDIKTAHPNLSKVVTSEFILKLLEIYSSEKSAEIKNHQINAMLDLLSEADFKILFDYLQNRVLGKDPTIKLFFYFVYNGR